MLYLHYWFEHSGYDARLYSEQANKTTLRRQLKEYKNIRRQNMTAGSTNPQAQEIMSLLENNLSGQDLSQEIAAQLEGNIIFTSSAQSGIGDYSFQQLGTLGSRITSGAISSASLGQQLISQLDSCQTTSKKALDNMINFLSKAYPNAISYAVNLYASTKQNIANSELLKKVLTSKSDLVEISPTENFSEAEQNIIKTYARIQAAIDLIPSLGSVPTKGLSYSTSKGSAAKGASIKGTNHLIAILVGKIGGNLSHLGGFAHEVAATRALEVAIKKGAAATTEVFSALTGGSNMKPIYTNKSGKFLSVTVSQRIDQELANLAKKDFPTITFNKNDASFVLTDDGLVLNFGGSIKRLPQPASGQIKNKLAKLQTSKNLQTLFNNARNKNHDLSKHYIYSLASGREKKENELGDDYSGPNTLASAWRSLVDYVVTLNFIDFLAGNGSRYNNNVLFLLENKLWGIEEILNRVIDNPNAIVYDGGKQRYRFYRDLPWYTWDGGTSSVADMYRKQMAQKRSVTWEADLTSKFNSTLITIKLNVAALFLI